MAPNKQKIIIPLLGSIVVLVLMGAFNYKIDYPMLISGDHLTTMVFAKIASADNSLTVSSQLAYPAIFNELGFPFTDWTQKTILFLCVKIANSSIAGMNIYYFVVAVLIYLAARVGIVEIIGASAVTDLLAISYVFLPYFVIRSAGHDFLAAYYSIPLLFYWMFKVHRNSSNDYFGWKKIEFVYMVVSAAIISTSGSYYTFFSLILLSLSFIVEIFYGRNKNAAVLFLFGVFTLVFFLVSIYPSIQYLNENGINLPSRDWFESTFTGARISDLMWTVSNYNTATKYFSFRGTYEGFDFWGGRFLGPISIIFIIFAPVVFSKKCLLQLDSVRKNPNLLIPVLVYIYMVFIFMLATSWGLGVIINYYITPIIRNYNRISPFYNFLVCLSVGLLYKSIDIKKSLKSTGLKIAIVILLVINICQNIGFMKSYQNGILSDDHSQANMRSVNSFLASANSADLKTLLMYPLSTFPEAPKINMMESYDQFLPFLLDDDSSKRRWSVGLRKDQDERAMLQNVLQSSDSYYKLHALGFDSIAVDKNGIDLNNDSTYLDFLKKLPVIYDDEFRTLFKIIDKESNQIIKSTKRTYQCGAGSHDVCNSFLTRGWSSIENWGVWGEGKVHSLVIPMQPGCKTSAVFKFKHLVTSEYPKRNVSLIVNGGKAKDIIFSLDKPSLTEGLEFSMDYNDSRYAKIDVVESLPLSPSQLGLNPNDFRKLGVGLESIVISCH